MKGKRENANEERDEKSKQAKTEVDMSANHNNNFDIDGTLDFPLTKHVSKGKWLSHSQRVEMMIIKGNYWRTMGYTENGKNYLHPEEALYLYEKNILCIVTDDENNANDEIYQKDAIYHLITSIISLPCYLCYSKLKMMDYIVTRYRTHQMIRNVSDDILQQMTDIDQLTIGNQFFSFSVYGNSSTWSKKSCQSTSPAGYVIVTNSELTFSPSLTISLLSQSHGVPLLFAIVTNTGHVYLEEFTDALQSLDWNLPVGTPSLTSPPSCESNNNDNLNDNDTHHSTEETIVPPSEDNKISISSSGGVLITPISSVPPLPDSIEPICIDLNIDNNNNLDQS